MAKRKSQAAHDRKMKWWREARFGMFIHWGLYASPAGTWKGKRIPGIAEWIQFRAKIPVREYEKLAEKFNPVRFDARAWVKLAVDAGMKYLCITSKHHDGFAIFKSGASPYNIVDATPYGKDPLRELARECKNAGIKLCFYYSQKQDWHHPDASGNSWDIAWRWASSIPSRYPCGAKLGPPSGCSLRVCPRWTRSTRGRMWPNAGSSGVKKRRVVRRRITGMV